MASDLNTRRRVTVGSIPPLNSEDNNNLRKRRVSVIPKLKLTRSKSSSFIPGLNYNTATDLDEMDGAPVTDNTPTEHRVGLSNDIPLDAQKMVGSAQNESLFNGTLIMTASPDNLSRNNTVIRRKDANGIHSPQSFMSTGSDHFHVDGTYKIQAVSPLSDEEASGNAAIIDEQIPQAEEEPKENEDQVEEVAVPGTSISILDPLRGILLNKSNSIFKEQSALETQEEHEEATATSAAPSTEGVNKGPKPSTSNSHSSSDNSSLSFKKERKGAKPLPLPYDNVPQKRSQKSLVIASITLACVCLAGLVVSIFFLVRGSKDMVINYFNHLKPSERYEFLESLNEQFYHVNTFPLLETMEQEMLELVNTSSLTGSKFNGMCYSPQNSMEPQCGTVAKDIEADVALLSTVTNKVRNDGMQCNQSEMILDAIHKLHLNMSLAMGIWIGKNETVNIQQLDAMKRILMKYPRRYFDSVFIGKEVLFRDDKTTAELVAIIKDVKRFVKKIGYIDLPVGTSEIGSLINKELLKECDIIGANIHPFFGGIDVSKAAEWTYDFLKYQIQPMNKEFQTKIIISEVGWPYKGGSYQMSVANSTNFQSFLQSFLCDSQAHGGGDYEYWYFEAFDEPWKKVFYEYDNQWETEWGFFTHDRKMKEGISLPNC